MDSQIEQILEQHPFLSYGELADRCYLGIIQNSDSELLSMYVYTDIPSQELRQKFINYGVNWWYGTNRQLPIHIYYKQNFRIFRPFLKHFSAKDFNLISGPSVSLAETVARRVRKRQVILVRDPNG